ncbi:hypothetical protein B484DRAFT_400997 [Ochromonadaceae sp. CCMP2298]|nr:hypothetical protein B484DRAFT_400997 [Ochromonadaceae sp. CCMP2298]
MSILVFGKDALKIVDYYGAAAAGKSVPLVVLCEAMGVLCGVEEAKDTNVGVPLLLTQLFKHFDEFIARQPGAWGPCQSQSPTSNLPKGKWEPTDLVQFFSAAFEARPAELQNLPMVKSNLATLVEHSAALDAKVRRGYGDRIMYANASANLHYAQSSIHVQEVDFEALRRNRRWGEWVRGVYEEAVGQKLLCDGHK